MAWDIGAFEYKNSFFIPRWEKYKDKKPTGPVEIDWNNPLTDSLHNAVVVDRDIVSNESLSSVFGNSISYSASTFGEGVVTGNGLKYKLSQYPFNDTSNNRKTTLIAITTLTGAIQQYSGVIAVNPGNNAGLKTRSTANRIEADNRGYITLLDAPTLDTYFLVCQGDTLYANTLRAGSARLYDNNLNMLSGSSTAGEFNYNADLYIGGDYRYVTGRYTEQIFHSGYLFHRLLSDDEIFALYEAPYQILKPRKTFFTFSASSSQTLTATLFSNNNTFYSPSANAGTVSLQPSVFNNTSSFYTPTVATSNTLQADVLSNTNTFYSHTLAEGSVALQPLLFTNNNTVYSSTVIQGTVALQPDLLSNENSFLSTTVSTSYTLQSGLITNNNSFYTQQLSASYALQPTLVSNTSEFYAPAGSTSYTLQADVLTNTQVFYNAIVSNEGSKVLVPERFDNTSLFYTPTLTTGTVSVQPSRFDNSGTFYTTTVTSTYPLQPSLYTNTSTFNAHTVSAGTVTLQSDLFVQTNNFYSATVVLGSGTQFIQPTLFENTHAFFSGVVVIEQFIAPSLFTNPNSFNTHAILDASLYKEIVEFNVSFKQLDSRSINIKQFVDFQTEL